MATRTIKARVALDGEAEYKQALQELNTGNRTLASEMKKLYSPAEVAEWGVFRMFVASMAVNLMGEDVSETGHKEESGPPETSGN